MIKQTNLQKQQGGKHLILSEADRRYRNEVARIEAVLTTAPSREKFIQSELDFIDRLLHTPKHINPRNDCVLDTLKGGFKDWYFMIDTKGYPLDYVRMLRHQYQIYLSGNINFIGEELTDKAKVIAEAIMLYKLEEWLTALRDGVEVHTDIHSLIKPGRDQGNYRIIDSLLLKCSEEISHIANFNSKNYAALYFIIFKKYQIFKTETTFTDLQNRLDQYFNQDTTSYKPNKLTKAAEALKSKYRWVDEI